MTKPKFYAFYKDFNNKKITKIDVLSAIWDEPLMYYDFKGTHKISTKEECKKFLENELRYHFWGKCEWEVIVCDWPCGETVDSSNPVKIDVWDQIKPNIDIITDLVWDYLVVNELVK